MEQYIKINGEWKKIVTVYKKINNHWKQQKYYDFDDNIYLYDSSKIDLDVLLIVANDSYSGKQFYLVAKLNNQIVYPEWSLASGSESFASINGNGKVSILNAASNSLITVQASYKGLSKSKNIRVTYDNQFTIECNNKMSGTSGNVIALYNYEVVNPTWSITKGGEYATINQSGEITILGNGKITVHASYDNLTTSKNINVTYDANSSSYVEVDPNTGAVITTKTTTTTDPLTGETTENTSSTTVNQDGSREITEVEIVTGQDGSTSTNTSTTYSTGGSVEATSTASSPDPVTGAVTTTNSTTVIDGDGSSSTSTSEKVTNQDGSSTEESTLILYDENGDEISSTESTVSISAEDSNGSVTTQSSSTTTNSGGKSYTSTATTIENADGSSSTESTRVNYDENGDVTGSTDNETVVNADGSSTSSTTNYDAEGDPTDKKNVGIDTSGNINTQDIEYENGEPVVTGYDIDTSMSDGDGKSYSSDGVNTDYYALDINHGFECRIHFTIDFTNQPQNQNDNHHNILTMKRADPSPWYGWQIRHSSTNKNIALGTQFSTGNNTNLSVSPGKWITSNKIGEYDLTITYDPTASTNKFVCYDNINETNVATYNSTFTDNNDLKYLRVCIGYAQDSNGDPYRFSNITIYDFYIKRIYPTWDSSESWDTSSQWVS